MNHRCHRLAERLEHGANALANFASGLTEREWRLPVPHDGRKVGVIVHHVASMYPIEMQLVQLLAAGQAIEGVTWQVVAEINAAHALEFDAVTRAAALELLRRNSDAAAAEIRALGDAALDRAAPISLYGDATLTCQFMLEDHPVRHSFHHLTRMRAALVLDNPAAATA
jgi:hypothetical protein